VHKAKPVFRESSKVYNSKLTFNPKSRNIFLEETI
jgi:hypothetical protein